MRCAAADDECRPGRLRLGLCELHYRRLRRRGDTSNPHVDNLHHYVIGGEDGCWIWQGAVWRNGYGKPSVTIHGTRLAHRMMYAEHVGPIPLGHDLDHLCHNADAECVRGIECRHRLCVNPSHLEPVLRRTNLMRAIATRAVCENGLHDLTLPGATKASTRQCVECWRISYRAAGKRYRARQRPEIT